MRSFLPWQPKIPARRPAPRKTGFRPTLEALEGRDLPSITLVNSTILIASGDDNGVHNDTYQLHTRPDTGQLQIVQSVGSTKIASKDVPAGVTAIVIVGDSGTDTVKVEALPARIALTMADMDVLTVGNNHTLTGIRGNMTLTTQNGGASTAVTFVDDLDTTDHTVIYTNDGGIMHPTADHTITITRDGVSGLTPQGTLDYSHAPLRSLTISTGSGTDSFIVLGTKADTTLNTGAGTDLVAVGQSPQNQRTGDLSGLHGTLTVNGGDYPLDQQLLIYDFGSPLRDTNYVLSTDSFTRTGQLTLPGGAQQPSTATINYSGFHDLHLLTGGSGAPAVRIKGTGPDSRTTLTTRGAVPVIVGNDDFRLDDVHRDDDGHGLDISAMDAAGQPTAGGALFLLDQGSTTAHGYTISGFGDRVEAQRDDDVSIGARNMAAVFLNGGSDADTFTVLEASGYGPAPVIPLLISGGGGANTLIGPDSATPYKITGTNAGAAGSLITFGGIANLTGGSADDTFAFQANAQGVPGSLSGAIDGGGGINKLDYSALTTGVTVDLHANSARIGAGAATTVLNIRNVTGSKGNDLIRGDDNANELRGVDGNDILIGLGGDDKLSARGIDNVGAGTTRRNILIGGLGSDTLEGSEGEDILLGGYFTNDLDDFSDAVLREFFRVWAGPGDYYSRADALNDDGVLVNGVWFQLNDDNIQRDDNSVDTLHGAGGLDWFWVSDADITDRIDGQEYKNDLDL
ncbi:MAG: hypothetical protein U0793_24585 [Gemmataceae bacterium]